jgi:high-affinity iron transporter
LLANFLIGLREGLEASLVVSILVAYLVRTRHRDRIGWVAAGVGAAVALSLVFGAVLTFTSRAMSFEDQETFAGVMSIVAVALVTGMVFWMRRAARSIKGELEGRLSTALSIGAPALVLVSFVSVGREGLETSLFVWAAAQSSDSTVTPLLGLVLGLAVAVGIGYLIYRGALRINLSRFFTWTGALLVLVAAGVLAYGVHDLQEAGHIPGLDDLAFDVSSTLPLTGWLGSLLKGFFNYNPAPTQIELTVWLAYLVPVMTAFWWPSARPRKPSDRREPATTR